MVDFVEQIASLFGPQKKPGMGGALKKQEALEYFAGPGTGREFMGVMHEGQPRTRVTEEGWRPPGTPPFMTPGLTESVSQGELPADIISQLFEKTKQYEMESTEGLEDLGPAFGDLMISPAMREEPAAGQIQDLVATLMMGKQPAQAPPGEQLDLEMLYLPELNVSRSEMLRQQPTKKPGMMAQMQRASVFP